MRTAHRLSVVSVCFLLIGLLSVIVSPVFTTIPSDFEYSASLIAKDNFYDAERGQYVGEQRGSSIIHYRIMRVSPDNTAVTVANTFEVKNPSGERLVFIERQYSIDPASKKHLPDTSGLIREGYLFAPRMRGLQTQAEDKSPFTYWHASYDIPALMEFKETELLYGLETYKYQASLIADQTSLLGQLPGVGRTRGVSTKALLTIWVEPYTGYLVKYEDAANAHFYTLKSGAFEVEWNRFRNEYTAESISFHAQKAAAQRTFLLLFTLYIPVLCLIALIALSIARYFMRAVQSPEATSASSIQPSRTTRRRTVLVIAVFLFFDAVALYSSLSVGSLNDRRIEQAFRAEVEDIQRRIENRLSTYSDILHAARGLFEASSEVERDEWRSFILGQHIPDRFPGLQGVGYALVVPKENLAEHVREMRLGGFPQYEVKPAGDRDVYTSVVYLEPFDRRNRAAIGYDMYQDSVRGPIMALARDTGELAISPKITLLQEIDSDVQPGFLMLLPIYRNDADKSTVRNRRAHLSGYVFIPFRAHNFMNEIMSDTNQSITISLYDGSPDEIGPGNILYTNELPSQEYSPDGRVATDSITFGGRTWTTVYRAGKTYGYDFLSSIGSSLALVAGLLLSVLITALIHVSLARRERLTRMAQGAIIALTEEKMRLKTVLHDVQEPIVITDAQGQIISFNAAMTSLLGWRESEVHNMRISDAFPLWSSDGSPLAAHEHPSELILQGKNHSHGDISGTFLCKAKDGSQIRVKIQASPILLSGKVIGVVQTLRKEPK